MRKLLVAIVLLFVICLSSATVQAVIIINEVMANEPEGNTTLEWIELHNTDDTTVSLKDHFLTVDAPYNIKINLPDNGTIEPSGYYIICRKLYSYGNTPGFEEYWGNNSGSWGDGLLEAQVPLPIERSFELINGSGTVRLFDSVGFEVNKLSWTQSGQDGHSWEKLSPIEGAIVEQSIDQRGATPGFLNSKRQVANDLALGVMAIGFDDPYSTITFGVLNRGYLISGTATLTIVRKTESGLYDDTVEVISLPPYTFGQFATVDASYNLPGQYVSIAAKLSDDQRNNNNVQEFIIPGRDFPGILLSEFLANPTAGATAEWIEIQNVSMTPLDVSSWQVGDSRNVHKISDNTLILNQDEFLVLVRDSVDFASAFPDFTGDFFQPTGWGPLNDGVDTVRLFDMLGIQAASIPYDEVFDDDHTWGRSSNTNFGWGPSLAAGGTPGEVNQVAALQNNDELSITASPGIFSPDGDGRDETVTITIEAPLADEYEMRIYDKQGRVVYTFDIGAFLAPEFIWDGYSDAGKRLPIGIYIIYFEAVGVESAKQTVVIAR